MTALGDAASAVLALQAGLRRGYPAHSLPGADDALAALNRLAESGIVRPLLLDLALSLRHGCEVTPCEVADALEDIGDAALDEVIAAVEIAAFVSRASRPASPPPPSGRGDEMALEMGATRDARDTEPPPPWSSEWWGDFPTVRC